MPIYTKKEFANEYEIQNNDLTVYINRGKVLMVDGNIDTNHPINADWCLRRELHLKKKAAKATVTTGETVVEQKEEPVLVVENVAKSDEVKPVVDEKKTETPTKKEVNQTKIRFSDPNAEVSIRESFDADAKIKKLNVTKTENDIAIQNEKLRKIQGESLPTDLVKNLFKHHSKSITVQFRNAVDNILMEVTAKHSLSSDDLGALRGKMVEVINVAVINATEESKKGLELMIAEQSTKKGVGERE